jgi:hypothetical protein
MYADCGYFVGDRAEKHAELDQWDEMDTGLFINELHDVCGKKSRGEILGKEEEDSEDEDF